MDGAAPAAQSAEAAKAKAADVTPPDVIENKGAGGGRGRSFKRGRLLGKVRAAGPVSRGGGGHLGAA